MRCAKNECDNTELTTKTATLRARSRVHVVLRVRQIIGWLLLAFVPLPRDNLRQSNVGISLKQRSVMVLARGNHILQARQDLSTRIRQLQTFCEKD